MATVQNCPERGALERLILGLLPPAEAEPLARHLEQCEACATVVSRVPHRDTLVDAVRDGNLLEEDAGDATIQRLMGRLKMLHPEPTVVVRSESLDFLAPPDRQGDLGQLAGFRILKLLGSGGMGLVFEAEDVQLGRRVALKVLHPDLIQKPLACQRFLREACAAAVLEHDNIVGIHQVGEHDGVPFLVMPLLHGISLEDRLRQVGTLPPVEVASLGRQVALGLAAAHERGLVHRDVKPGNLWLEGKQGGRIKILDFGLVHLMREEARVTLSGAILGTPSYMAPEQAAGKNVDQRSDLFALGCVLYRMTTGAGPFDGVDTMAVLSSLAMTEPSPVHTVNPRVPVALSGLIMELLAKDPAQRPASAADVARRLESIERETRNDPLKGWKRAWRAAAILLGMGVLLLLFGGPVVRFATNRGVLVVEIDDPDVEVVVKQGGVTLMDRAAKREYVLAAAAGEVEVYEKDGVRLATRKFELTRGGKTRVTVTSEELDETRNPPKVVNRRAALWALALGGKVSIDASGTESTVAVKEKLPAEPFMVREMDLSAGKVPEGGLKNLTGLTRLTLLHVAGDFSDEDLKNLQGLIGLETLLLHSDRMTDAGVARLTSLTNLQYVVLHSSSITAQGLKSLQRLPKLNRLGVIDARLGAANRVFLRGFANLNALMLTHVDITDSDLVHLSAFEKLADLCVSQTEITDVGLAHLAGYKTLRAVDVRNTKVTLQGVNALKNALPKCAIKSDLVP